MKKVSVQFNMMIEDDVTHEEVKEAVLKGNLQNDIGFGKRTSIQVNNVVLYQKAK